MKPYIVVSDGMDKNIFARLQEIPEFDVHTDAKMDRSNLLELLPKAGALVVRSATTVDEELLSRADNLKYIIRAGEGTDNIDKKLCGQKGIKVSNTPFANSNSAAEHAIALMMSLLRKTPWAHTSMGAGKWEKSHFAGNELWKKTLGIVGMGRIGQIVAKRLSGFEVKVLFFDPYIKEVEGAQKVETLDELFSSSNIITVHLPLIEQTKGLINAKVLSQMKETAILVNAARGGIVDEDALYALLREKRIRGAALDVYASEPLPKDSKLRTLDNIVLTPHLGASTEEAQVRVGEMVLHQLEEFFKGNLLNEVRA